MRIMKFPFSAPLQSWGENARWDTRTTTGIPTKSGVIGFLGCCLGYPRGDKRLNELEENIRIAVRVDKSGQVLTDFQTVQGTDGVLLNAAGKPRGGDTIITPKQYLQDARFTIFLEGDDQILTECFDALLHPYWTPYLGRKNCAPAVPIKPQWVDKGRLEDAVAEFSEDEKKQCDGNVVIEMDADLDDVPMPYERTYTRIDTIIRADRNEYAARRVKSYVVSSGGEKP